MQNCNFHVLECLAQISVTFLGNFLSIKIKC